MRPSSQIAKVVVEVTASRVRFLQVSVGDKNGLVFQEVAPSLSSLGKKSCPVIAALPRSTVILKQLRLPAAAEEELEGMMELQAGQILPYSKEEVVWEYVRLGRDSSGFMKVLIVALNRETAERYCRIFLKAGIRFFQLTFSSWGLLQWYLQYSKSSGQPIDGLFVLIHLEEEHTEVCFIEQETLCFSRSFPLGEKNFSSENRAAWKRQIALTIGAYKKENRQEAPGRALLVSSDVDALLLAQELQETIAIPVDFAAAREGGQDGIFPGAVSLGLGLCDQEKIIDLLPVEIKERRQREKRKARRLKASLFFFVALFLGIVAGGMPLIKDGIYLKQLHEQVASLEPRVRFLEARKKKIEFMKNYLASRIQVAELFSELFSLTPPDVFLSSVTFDESGVLLISGFTEDASQVNVFQEQLLHNASLKNATLQYMNKQKSYDTELTYFQISCQVVKIFTTTAQKLGG